MPNTIDFTRDGYHGDAVEELFKGFTSKLMPFWWHFREVLRANQSASGYWQNMDGTVLPDIDQRELVALSLLNYAVYTGIGEALAFSEEMEISLFRTMSLGDRIFQVRRDWKSTYSSLYTSFNALCNIIVILVSRRSAFGANPSGVWNYTPKNALDLVSGRGIKSLAEPLDRCRDRLEIRDHLDHYWTIWVDIDKGKFLMDANFKKGYAPLHPEVDISTTINALEQTKSHIIESMKDFDLVFRELAIKAGYLDQYLAGNGWNVEYTGNSSQHNNSRPVP